jgi:hypothetical protein
MLGPTNQGIDNPSESQQTLVDHSSLSCPRILCPATTHILGPSEINQIQPSYLQQIVSDGRCLLDVSGNSEYGVRSGRMVVELGGSNLSMLTACRKEGECISSILDADFFFEAEGLPIGVGFKSPCIVLSVWKLV